MPFRTSSPRRSGCSAVRAVLLWGSVLLLGGLTGCQQLPKVAVSWQGGPFFTPTNFSGVPLMPAEVRRVAVLPLSGLDGLPPETVAALESALRAALLAEGRFEVVAVRREWMQAQAGRGALATSDQLPAPLFERLAREYSADAVLLVDISHYRPYAPLALGVRAKLAFCAAPHAVFWAFDTLFDSRVPAVANSARRHAAGGPAGKVDSGPVALQSPSRFAAYVFADVFACLPQRPAPVPAAPPAR